nr:hypothetical protein [Halogranum amylolyticum]
MDRRTDDRTVPTAPADGDRDDSWVARCQSQFDATRTDRLGNLVDAENQAMPTGTTESRDP